MNISEIDNGAFLRNSVSLFHNNTPSQMLDRVLNTSMGTPCRVVFIKNCL